MVDQPEHIDDVFNCPPVYNGIFSCLSPADIIRTGQACRLLRDAVAHFHSLAYNINRHLTHFVKDPVALRRLQVTMNFLISGSNALQFLNRTFYPTSDLDIFSYPESVKELGRHLIKEEGYVFVPGEKQHKDFDKVTVAGRNTTSRRFDQAHFIYNSGMSDLLKFKNPKRDLEIQIISCRRTPLDCILYFHSTCVMNFITYDSAYSLYPKATFDKRIAIAFGSDLHEPTKRAFDKYSERGWEFAQDMSYTGVQALKPLIAGDVTRYLDDKYTWILPIDTTDLDLDEADPSQKNPFHCNSWVLKRDFTGYSTVITLSLTYQAYESEYLQHVYLFAEPGLPEAISHLMDYLVGYNPSKRQGREYLDSYIPALRDAHVKLPKRFYVTEGDNDI